MNIDHPHPALAAGFFVRKLFHLKLNDLQNIDWFTGLAVFATAPVSKYANPNLPAVHTRCGHEADLVDPARIQFHKV